MNKKTITIRELLDEFVRETVDPSEKSPRDIDCQKLGFLCGVVSAIAYLGDEFEIDTSEIDKLFFEVVESYEMASCATINPSRN